MGEGTGKRENLETIKNMAYYLAMAFLTLVVAICSALTVCGRSHAQEAQTEEEYLAKERKLTQKVREYLGENGFPNSGVMVTRVVNADETRVYTITVHHDRIDAMEDEAREDLAEEIKSLGFSEEGICFKTRFMFR